MVDNGDNALGLGVWSRIEFYLKGSYTDIKINSMKENGHTIRYNFNQQTKRACLGLHAKL